MRVAIIGAGASGIACALTLLKKNIDVTIFDSNDKIGKKLSITGNGKCNVANLDFGINKYNENSHSFLTNLFKKISVLDVLELFCECGVDFYNKDGYVYPASNSAKSLVYAICDKLNSYAAFHFIQKRITNLNELNDFDRIIVASGGCAYPKTGSTGDAYKFALDLNHRIIEPKPALTSIIVKENLNDLKGSRINCKINLESENKKLIYTEKGNVQFNKNSISGIPIMNLSRYVSRNENEKFNLYLNFFENENYDSLLKKLVDRKKNLYYRNDAYFLIGLVDDNLAINIMKQNKTIEQITNSLIAYKLTVASTESFDIAQVCTGGICLNEINDNFSSKLNSKIYFIGECLDVDGICGGYNLTFAFMSGIICGKEMQ